MPGRRKSSKSTRGKLSKSARRGGGWFTSETKEECVATCNKNPDAPSQGGLLASVKSAFKSINPLASKPEEPKGMMESASKAATDSAASVAAAAAAAAAAAGLGNQEQVEPTAAAAGGGRRSRRRRYRRNKSRIRKRR